MNIEKKTLPVQKKVDGRRRRRMVKSFITDTRRSICEQVMDKIRFKGY